ncbi:hypothetical protein TrST_g320 [Triparma strigata]|uniref:USP domain-containing protein n=1 Tax=Triparma strigata TaxID=1606541 RepID=A0A9W6ZKB8_9STRA|nr:hypothetical protein TrST_g320 [Triparma strigata]
MATATRSPYDMPLTRRRSTKNQGRSLPQVSTHDAPPSSSSGGGSSSSASSSLTSAQHHHPPAGRSSSSSRHQFRHSSSLTNANFGGSDSPKSGGGERLTMMQRRQQRLDRQGSAPGSSSSSSAKMSMTLPSYKPTPPGGGETEKSDLQREAEDMIARSGNYLAKINSKKMQSSSSFPSVEDAPPEGVGGGGGSKPLYKREKVAGSGITAVRGLSGGSGANSASSSVPISPSSTALVGLTNLGNTCFMNSALQCVFNAPPVKVYFGGDGWKGELKEDSPMRGQLAKGFAEVFRAIHAAKAHSVVNPNGLKRLVGKWAPHLSGFAQQDSQEFMRFLLDGLAEDLNNRRNRTKRPEDLSEEELDKVTSEIQSNYWWKRHLANNDSFITETFCGQLMSTVECCHCSTRSYCFDPFYDLSVPIPSSEKKGGVFSSSIGSVLERGRRSFGKKDLASVLPGGASPSGVTTLEDCLRLFTSPETIDGDNKPLCTKCKKKRKSIKRITVHRFPPILVLHMKRFTFPARTKLTTPIRFPLNNLDMSTFSCHNQCSPEPLYDLFAYTNHMGSLSGGHYTATCKSNDGKWYTYNDSHVGEEVVGDDGWVGDDGCPYVLFYKKRT